MRSKNLMCALVGGAVALALSGAALAADASKLALPGDLTLAQAQKVVAAAEAKAEAQGTLMNIAVIDTGGNLKAFGRMDGGLPRQHRHRAQEGQDRSLLQYVVEGIGRPFDAWQTALRH